MSEVNVRLGALLSGISRSTAIFVYIMRRLFTYQVKVSLGAIISSISRSSASCLFTSRDRPRHVRPPPLFTC